MERTSPAVGGERGQTLILFVSLFSVVMLLAAFAMEQGFWYGNRRVAQKDADAAARAGARVLVDRLDDNTISGSDEGAAIDDAWEIVERNGASGADSEFLVGADCNIPDPFNETIDNAPSIEVAVPRPAPGLFTRLLYADVDDTLDEIGARSLACVGAVQTLRPDSAEGIPAAIVRPSASVLNDPDYHTDRDCFSDSGALDVGRLCVLVWSEEDVPKWGGPESLINVPSDDECEGSGSSSDDIGDGIRDGIDFTCRVNTGGSCSSDDQDCVNDFAGASNGDHIDGLERRLNGIPNACDSLDPRTNFQSTFVFSDGTPLTGAEGPLGVGGTDPPGRVYALRGCDNPRLVLVPVIDDDEHIRGYAMAFITGCFRNDTGLNPFEPLNTCDFILSTDVPLKEIRAVIVRTFLSKDSVGLLGNANVGDPNIGTRLNAALTIQTTR